MVVHFLCVGAEAMVHCNYIPTLDVPVFKFRIHMDLMHWWNYSIWNSLLVIPLLAQTKIDQEGKTINLLLKKKAILRK